jgi:RNA polymerase sigma factor (TIGR02999 family)
MTVGSRDEITQLLRAWGEGDQSALEKLIPLVYDELRRRAHRYMAHERPDHTLQTTALVHEAYVQLVDAKRASWQDRAHFFAVCARVMRHILADRARSRHALKRGGQVPAVSLEKAPDVSDKASAQFVALDDAMTALAAFDQRKCQVVEMRFLGGLSVEEIAEVLKVSPHTVTRDWNFAKAWLLSEMSGGQKDEA